MKQQDDNRNLIFLNTPIMDCDQDVIGINTYVEKLNAAIDSGAQMIAITSPFGSGKTSIVELLERKRCKNKKKEKLIKVSMWLQINNKDEQGSTTDLHKNFVYQLASQINHKRGTYINRRLSPNYGLLKIHANKLRYWFLFLFAITALVMSWIIHTFPQWISLCMPFLKNNLDLWTTGLLFVGIVLALVVATKAEIIYSFAGKTYSKRKIEATEIIDLYREEILKHKNKLSRKKCFIVVIEDLDRTTDAKAVIGFLKELRKYYVPQKEGENIFDNKVVFIVNVKPEALLINQVGDGECDKSLYAKIFDYELSLQTVNIDNYDSILEGLLQEKKELIGKLGLPTDEKLSDIPGMKWIIRERRLGIREIKERLNIAFLLYESLKNKFGSNGIAFEKCTVVAYLTTAFEHDFYNTDDRAFQELVNQYLKGELTEYYCIDYLKNTSKEYAGAVNELISAKLIDTNYRTYFYNYPKGSYLYSSDESQVINAILYSEDILTLEEIAKRVVSSNSLATQRAFVTLEQLGLQLPQTVFKSETLYIEALKKVDKKIFQYFDNLDYSEDAATKTIEFFKNILSYDKSRKTYDEKFAEKICESWEKNFSETALLQLRFMLCQELPLEILWYKDLFGNVHALIREQEMELISLIDAISLINWKSRSMTLELMEYLLNRFKQEELVQIKEDREENIMANKVENLLRLSSMYFQSFDLVPLYMTFMETQNCIVTDFEKEIFEFLSKSNVFGEKEKNIFSRLQVIINQNAHNLSKQTLEYISNLNHYDGFNIDVANQLKENEYYTEYTLILLKQKYPIPFDNDKIRTSLEKDIKKLLENMEYFTEIRNLLSQQNEKIILKYAFLFDPNCPIMTSEELTFIQDNNKDCEEIIIKLIPATKVTVENYKMISNFFNRRKQKNNVTFEILMYVAMFSLNVSEECFYALNFDSIRYQFISREKQLKVREAFSNILKLEMPNNKIKYMKTTKCIDNTWETALLELIKTDINLQKEYINAVNNCEKITKNTILLLCKIGTICAMSPQVNKKFLENKKYTEYVVSETLGKSRFEFAEGELKQLLWQTYIKIFSENSYLTVRQYMTNNKSFVSCVMKEKSYIGFPKDNRMQLCGVYQDKESLRDVLSYGEDYALKYYSSIAGFVDEASATEFVEIVANSKSLIASDDLYSHTHQMLISSSLKGRYTNIRKKMGYGK